MSQFLGRIDHTPTVSGHRWLWAKSAWDPQFDTRSRGDRLSSSREREGIGEGRQERANAEGVMIPRPRMPPLVELTRTRGENDERLLVDGIPALADCSGSPSIDAGICGARITPKRR